MPDRARAVRDPTVIFLHIGKTAGWTLRQILYRNVPSDLVMRVRPPADRPRGFLNEEPLRAFASLPQDERARPRLIVSHMIFGIHASVPRSSTYITLLREPVARERAKDLRADRRIVAVHHASAQRGRRDLQEALPHRIRAAEAVEQKDSRVLDAALTGVRDVDGANAVRLVTGKRQVQRARFLGQSEESFARDAIVDLDEIHAALLEVTRQLAAILGCYRLEELWH